MFQETGQLFCDKALTGHQKKALPFKPLSRMKVIYDLLCDKQENKNSNAKKTRP